MIILLLPLLDGIQRIHVLSKPTNRQSSALHNQPEDGSSTLRLTINDADEMGFSDGDVKVDATGALDFTEIILRSINGVDSNSLRFETKLLLRIM